jgi:CheY-like chemotaxis protein
LVVEDNPSDVYLIRAAIEHAGLLAEIQTLRDGEQAMRHFEQLETDEKAVCPAVVILDINLPRRQGGEVLQYMRQTRRCANTPVIVVSTSGSAQDRGRMIECGANDYFRKPSEYEEFMKLGSSVKELLKPRD